MVAVGGFRVLDFAFLVGGLWLADWSLICWVA